MSTPDERSQLNDVSDIVDRQVRNGRGDVHAVIAGETRLTYDQLRREINRAGNLMRGLGIRREQRVLLVLDDTADFPIMFLGAIRIGAVPVPVGPLDKDENFRHYIDDSYASLIVTDPTTLDRLATILGDRDVRYLVRGGSDDRVIELEEALRRSIRRARRRADPSGRRLLLAVQLGCSTGKPKGVVHLQHDISVTYRRLRRVRFLASAPPAT